MAKLTKEKVTNCLKGSALTLATLAGVIGGVIFGLALRTREGKKYLQYGNCANLLHSSVEKITEFFCHSDFEILEVVKCHFCHF